MSYEKTVWVDHVVDGDIKYTATQNPDGTLTLTPVLPVVVQEGTRFTASRMNNIEEGVEAAHEQLAASELLNKIKSVDGSGSGLDADTVDGKHVQNSVTDGSTDRLMLLGAFGWGVSNPSLEYENPDDVIRTSVIPYTTNKAITYGLPLSLGGVLFTKAWNTGQYTTQEYTNITDNTPHTFIRHRNYDSWTDWEEVYHEGNSDVIVEKGSNANGYYMKFSDGTMICTHSVASITTGHTRWTFPASFNGGRGCFGQVVSNAGLPAATYQIFSIDNDGADFNTVDSTGNRLSKSVGLLAIGTWR